MKLGGLGAGAWRIVVGTFGLGWRRADGVGEADVDHLQLLASSYMSPGPSRWPLNGSARL